eukprot:4489019-Pleurochrysis_carterae.AAC.1
MADDTDEASSAGAVVDNPYDEPLPASGTLYFYYLKNFSVGAKMGLRLDAHNPEEELIVYKTDADRWLVPVELSKLLKLEHGPLTNLQLLQAVRIAVDNEK